MTFKWENAVLVSFDDWSYAYACKFSFSRSCFYICGKADLLILIGARHQMSIFFSEWVLDCDYIYWYSRSQMSIFVCILTAYTHLWASKHISWLCLDYHLKSIKLMHCNLHIHIKWLGKEYFWRLLRGITLDILHCRHCNPLARRFHGFENTISFWTEHNKQALFASGRDSPSTKQSSSRGDSSSSPDGPPVLTILAGVIVFLLVLWVIGSILTWIVGLVFGAAKS